MGLVRVFIGKFNYQTLQFREELQVFLIRQKKTNLGIFQYAVIMLCLGARLCFCRRVFLYPILVNIDVAGLAVVPRPLISILLTNLKIEIGGNNHEENQS